MAKNNQIFGFTSESADAKRDKFNLAIAHGGKLISVNYIGHSPDAVTSVPDISKAIPLVGIYLDMNKKEALEWTGKTKPADVAKALNEWDLTNLEIMRAAVMENRAKNQIKLAA